MRRAIALIAGLAFFAGAPQAGLAQYEGKTITIVVGFKTGGGYDRTARILARHLPKYLPGKPSVVVQNMPGANTIIAANHVYSGAKPDRLTLPHGHIPQWRRRSSRPAGSGRFDDGFPIGFGGADPCAVARLEMACSAVVIGMAVPEEYELDVGRVESELHKTWKQHGLDLCRNARIDQDDAFRRRDRVHDRFRIAQRVQVVE